mgnify:CR=1 FL=1
MTLPDAIYCANLPPLQAVTTNKGVKYGVLAPVCGNMATIMIEKTVFFNDFLMNGVVGLSSRA